MMRTIYIEFCSRNSILIYIYFKIYNLLFNSSDLIFRLKIQKKSKVKQNIENPNVRPRFGFSISVPPPKTGPEVPSPLAPGCNPLEILGRMKIKNGTVTNAIIEYTAESRERVSGFSTE
jgi:hypothetical protein